MTRRVATVVASLAAGLALASAATAAPPTHFTDSIDYSGSVGCGSFADMYQGHLDISGVTTLDRNGNAVRDVVHITGWERNWRSDRPSVSMTAIRNFTVVFVYATGVESDNGNVFTQVAPGQGVLFHDVGKIAFAGEDVTIHGPHDVFDQGDAAFCNALLALS
jgi:hypothetical protein